ncbi:MAG: class I SAM-dependent methyltransferase, partial [Candidatus Omnitrophica bacterium]|nr:class I SAM-dependent methyltransferase [Candidatus Omnitrophota bacterium]
MAEPWNLEPDQWANVLSKDTSPAKLAQDITKGRNLPWVETIIKYSADANSVIDLGSGNGQNSAVLARLNKKTTLLDFSQNNIDFSQQLYKELGLQGTFLKGDITQRLPFDDNAFDVGFTCGVLEYFSDEQLR